MSAEESGEPFMTPTELAAGEFLARAREAGKSPAELARDRDQSGQGQHREPPLLECRVFALLDALGWSVGEIALATERQVPTVARHLEGECSHDHGPVELEEVSAT